MAAGRADVATGTTIGFGTSAFVAKLLSISQRMTRESIDTSHMGTTLNRTFIPGDLVDRGEVDIEFLFDPDDEPPIDKVAETVTITFPLFEGGITPATFEFSAFMTDYEDSGELEGLLRATAKLKISGAITYTAGT